LDGSQKRSRCTGEIDCIDGQEVAALPVFKHQIQRHVRRMLGRTDEQSLQAIAVVLGLLDNALARQ